MANDAFKLLMLLIINEVIYQILTNRQVMETCSLGIRKWAVLRPARRRIL